MTLAYMPNADQVTHVTQSGRLQGAQSTDMIDMCVGGCRMLFQIMRKGLLRRAGLDRASMDAAKGAEQVAEDRVGDP